MLPTPSTSHVDTDRIYEPAEDSYLLLDTLSSAAETQFLTQRFAKHEPTGPHHEPNYSPLVLEVGTGSGVVLAFVTAHAHAIFGRADVTALGTDVNSFACKATGQTVAQACQAGLANDFNGSGLMLATINADLTSPLRDGMVDLLIFNPPYVPSPGVPELQYLKPGTTTSNTECTSRTFEEDSHLLQLSYDGGVDGIEVTNRLLDRLPNVLNLARGTAYILLCSQNKPEEVMQRIRGWGDEWSVCTVSHSGKKAGWEKLQIIRIWRH
ncbi:S-adenosylmethionine-dependent methyltransferase [Imshaugia aleurites]|uniref:S-adenosylmethionine-dependent methyltransferase n=1 Tax=Imshaugia aleurites TaxID=172621 RepID=A0A8H3IK97_9LECA|nr:S-adenosylmethionine-dependent methyltransferase [Imshaugia aleurites]